MKKNTTLSTELVIPQEVEIHYKRALFNEMVHIKSSIDAETFIKKYINLHKLDHKEFFWVLLLSRANRVLAFSEIGAGSDVGVVVHIKEIFQLILATNANAFIVCHNHPSGSLQISEQDKIETKKIKYLSKYLSVNFLDHIIITSESYISFANESLL